MVEGETVHLEIEGTDFVAGQTKLLTSSNLRISSIRVLSPSSLDATAVAGPRGTATVQVSVAAGVSAAVSVNVLSSPVGSTISLTPVYLAGRTASTISPDGIGSGAYLDQLNTLTGCRGKIYFVDRRGLRSLDPQTQQVTTLVSQYLQLQPGSIWCDGNWIYSSSTVNAGRLTIQQLNIDTLQTSTFSFAATASYTRGTWEYVQGIGKTLFTTDSSAGRLWKIDLTSRVRTLVSDFGGPMFSSTVIGSHPPDVLPAGPFWTDGSAVYVLRPQSPGVITGVITVVRIRLDTGESVVLTTGNFYAIYGVGTVLYLTGFSSIQQFDLETGQFTPFLTFEVVPGFGVSTKIITWDDGQSLYFIAVGAIGKINPITKLFPVPSEGTLMEAVLKPNSSWKQEETYRHTAIRGSYTSVRLRAFDATIVIQALFQRLPRVWRFQCSAQVSGPMVRTLTLRMVMRCAVLISQRMKSARSPAA